MKLGLFGYNVGPGKLMLRLADAAKARGVDPLVIPSLCPKELEDIASELRKCAAVVLGISYEYDKETAVAKMLGDSSSIFVIEDHPRNALAETDPLRGAAALMRGIFPALPGYEDELAAYGYRPEGIVQAGPPAHWQDDMLAFRDAKAMRKKEQVRKRMQDGTNDSYPVLTTDRVLYVSGAKNIRQEIQLVAQLIETFRNTLDRTVIHYRGHPGERRDFREKGREKEYDDLLAQMSAARLGTWGIANDSLQNPTDPAQRAVADAKSHGIADISVAHPGASAWNWLGYEGHLGLAAMPLVWDSDVDYEKSSAVEGVACVVRTIADVRGSIAALSDPAGIADLQKRQSTYLRTAGEPVDWNTAPKVIDSILKRL